MPVIPPNPTYAVATSGVELITEALELLGVLAEGETPSAADLKTAKRSLNFLLDNLNSQKNAIHAITQVTKALTASDGSYTIGAGGDIDTIRPPMIERGWAFLKDGNQEYPLDVLTVEEWAAITDKTLTSLPHALYYEPTVPLGTVYLYPVPLEADTLVLWIQKLLAQITDVHETIHLPVSYASYLANMLAVRVAPKFGKIAPPEVVDAAREARAHLKAVNSRTPRLVSDAPGAERGSFNINRGY